MAAPPDAPILVIPAVSLLAVGKSDHVAVPEEPPYFKNCPLPPPEGICLFPALVG